MAFHNEQKKLYCSGADGFFSAWAGMPALTGPTNNNYAPIEIQSDVIDAKDFVALSGGDQHWCALRSNGTVFCWGKNVHGETEPPDLTPAGPNALPVEACDGIPGALWDLEVTGHAQPQVYRSSFDVRP